MREILFRGKRTDNGEWIYGYVNQQRGEPILDCMYEQINSDDFYIYDYAAKIDAGIYGLLYKIIPETVGQFTGLTDKNGVKIFEGDIVDYISSDVIGNPKTGTIIVEDMTDYDTMIYLNHSDELQIIGNIHENPELLDREECENK